MEIWIVLIDNEYGTSHYAYKNYLDAYDSVRDYLEENFEPDDYDGPGAQEGDYCEYVNGDTVVISETTVQ